nr:ribonuclease H-like domain, reverse transcriptase, RNA-dependent DNA polymerase [Tanacetum cinerariifolium]
MECEDLAASISLLTNCEKVVPSKVVVDKDDEMLMLVFDEALGVGDEIHSLLREGVSVAAKLSLWAFALFEFVLPFIRKQIEQQRLGVDEMYWVGNKIYKEEQEEQEEEEDEYDKEVEEGKHGDANVRDEALQTRHIGVDRVQKARLQTLKTEFEMLKMKDDDSTDEFIAKLNSIVTRASGLGSTFDQQTLVRKLLCFVPKRFIQIVEAIKQFTDLEETTLDEAIGFKNGGQEKFRSYQDNKQDGKTKQFNNEKKPSHKFKRNNFRKDKGQEQSNLVQEDVEPTLLMAIQEKRDEGKKIFLDEKEIKPKKYISTDESLWIIDEVSTQDSERNNEYSAPNPIQNITDDDISDDDKIEQPIDNPSTPPSYTYEPNLEDSTRHTSSIASSSRPLDHTPVRGYINLSEIYNRAPEIEIDSINKNKTWKLATLPDNHMAIGLKWVFKTKRDGNGNIIKHKARLVSKGYVQEHGIDYDEVFAPVARMETVRLILALSAYHGWEVHHLDVKSAFLHGELKEEVYVTQLEGFKKPGNENKVYRYVKALYGLKQAPRAWNMKLDQTLKSLNFKKCTLEQAIYTRIKKDSMLLVGVYVDDLIVTQSRIEVTQTEYGISIKQTGYANNILKEGRMVDSNETKIPMDPGTKLIKTEGGELVDATEYRSLIGCLRYLFHTRPDLSYSVRLLSRFMQEPREQHMKAIRQVLRYIKGTLNFGVNYYKKAGCKLLGYSDSSYGINIEGGKGTTGSNNSSLSSIMATMTIGCINKLEGRKVQNTSEYSTMSGGVPPSESFFSMSFISENVLSFIDVALHSLVQSYMDDVLIAVRDNENLNEAIVKKECLFPYKDSQRGLISLSLIHFFMFHRSQHLNVNSTKLNLSNILAEVSQTGKKRYIPYRDFRLRYLLHESLGGNAELAIVYATSPHK